MAHMLRATSSNNVIMNQHFSLMTCPDKIFKDGQDLMASDVFKFKETDERKKCWTKLCLTYFRLPIYRGFEVQANRLQTFQCGLNASRPTCEAERFASGGFHMQNDHLVCYWCDLQIPVINLNLTEQCPFDIHAKAIGKDSCAFFEVFKMVDKNGAIVKQYQAPDDQTEGANSVISHDKKFFLYPCCHVVKVSSQQFWDLCCLKQAGPDVTTACPFCHKQFIFFKQVPP